MTLALTAMFVLDDDLAGTGNHHQFALAIGHITHGGVETDVAVGLGFHAGGHRRTRRCTTNVEGTHGQLGTGFTDGLRRNHTHGLTTIDQTATAQVATITTGADAKTGFAG